MKVVFHLNDLKFLPLCMSNIKNILKMDVTQVVLLVNGPAITIFKDTTLDPSIDDTRFIIIACQNSMNSNNVTTNDLFAKTEVVASGVYTLAKLQTQGYAYIKP